MQARRHILADQANAQDQKLYEIKQAQLENEIEQANQALESHKAQLQIARADKKRKLQYEVLLNLVQAEAALSHRMLLQHSSGQLLHEPQSWECVSGLTH